MEPFDYHHIHPDLPGMPLAMAVDVTHVGGLPANVPWPLLVTSVNLADQTYFKVISLRSNRTIHYADLQQGFPEAIPCRYEAIVPIGLQPGVVLLGYDNVNRLLFLGRHGEIYRTIEMPENPYNATFYMQTMMGGVPPPDVPISRNMVLTCSHSYEHCALVDCSDRHIPAILMPIVFDDSPTIPDFSHPVNLPTVVLGFTEADFVRAAVTTARLPNCGPRLVLCSISALTSMRGGHIAWQGGAGFVFEVQHFSDTVRCLCVEKNPRKAPLDLHTFDVVFMTPHQLGAIYSQLYNMAMFAMPAPMQQDVAQRHPVLLRGQVGPLWESVWILHAHGARAPSPAPVLACVRYSVHPLCTWAVMQDRDMRGFVNALCFERPSFNSCSPMRLLTSPFPLPHLESTTVAVEWDRGNALPFMTTSRGRSRRGGEICWASPASSQAMCTIAEFAEMHPPVSRVWTENSGVNVDSCAICRDVLMPAPVWITACGHAFHKACLQTWFGRLGNSPRCPLCNGVLEIGDGVCLLSGDLRATPDKVDVVLDAALKLEAGALLLVIVPSNKTPITKSLRAGSDRFKARVEERGVGSKIAISYWRSEATKKPYPTQHVRIFLVDSLTIGLGRACHFLRTYPPSAYFCMTAPLSIDREWCAELVKSRESGPVNLTFLYYPDSAEDVLQRVSDADLVNSQMLHTYASMGIVESPLHRALPWPLISP